MSTERIAVHNTHAVREALNNLRLSGRELLVITEDGSNHSSLVIPLNRLNDLRESLGVSHIDPVFLNTDEPEQLAVIYAHFGGTEYRHNPKASYFFDAVILAFAKELGRNVYIRDLQGSSAAVSQEEMFEILFYGVPAGVELEYKMYRVIDDIRLNSYQEDGHENPGALQPIEVGGNVIGEAVENGFYIYMNLTRYDGAMVSSTEQTSALLLERMLNAYKAQTGVLTQFESGELVQALMAEHYVRFAELKLKSEREQTSKRLATTRSRIQELTQQLTALYLEESNLAALLPMLAAFSNEKADELRSEFQRLQELEEVEYVQIGETFIEVFTKPLIAYPVAKRNEYRPLKIDRCKIRIFLSEGTVRLRIYSAVPLNHGPHPHVYSDGTQCLGNIGSDVSDLLGHYKFGELIGLVITFLKRFNPNSPATEISSFQVA